MAIISRAGEISTPLNLEYSRMLVGNTSSFHAINKSLYQFHIQFRLESKPIKGKINLKIKDKWKRE